MKPALASLAALLACGCGATEAEPQTRAPTQQVGRVAAVCNARTLTVSFDRDSIVVKSEKAILATASLEERSVRRGCRRVRDICCDHEGPGRVYERAVRVRCTFGRAPTITVAPFMDGVDEVAGSTLVVSLRGQPYLAAALRGGRSQLYVSPRYCRTLSS